MLADEIARFGAAPLCRPYVIAEAGVNHEGDLNTARQLIQEAADAGHTIREIENPLEHPDWQGPLKTGIENYLVQLEERGLDQARDVYQAALAASESCSAQ